MYRAVAIALCISGLTLLLASNVSAAVLITHVSAENRAIGIGTPNRVVDFDQDGLPEIVFSSDGGGGIGGTLSSHVEIQGIPETLPDTGAFATPLPLMALVSATSASLGDWTVPTSSNRFTLRFVVGSSSFGYWPTGLSLGEPLFPGGPVPLIPDSGYLAVRFTNTTGTHYGWVDLGVYEFSASGNLNAFGWETDAGVPILAGVPEPQRMLLIVSAFGALLNRRRRAALGAG